MDKLKLASSQLKEKWRDKKDRRQILAFIGAGIFLVISFWTSFQDRRLKQNIANAQLIEKLESGRSSIPFDSDSTSIVTVQLDESGRVSHVESDPSVREQVEEVLAKSNFTAMKRNNVPQRTKVPVPIPLIGVQEQKKRTR